ncbi:MAG: hypothetical protein ACYTG5_05755 [Planctomycetota bacterium]|jgi:hypothetical protein
MMFEVISEWWNNETAAWVGGVGGATVGVIGGIYGATVGMLAPKGIGRQAVLSVHFTLLALGSASLITGLVAWLSSQPYHVYYPVLLLGGVRAPLMGFLLPAILQRYRQAEARKMAAEELRRS